MSDMDQFIDEWNRFGLRSSTHEAMLGFVRSGRALELVVTMINEAPPGRSHVLGLVVDLLSPAELVDAVTSAVHHAMSSAESIDAVGTTPTEFDFDVHPARVVIERAGLQAPEALLPYLPAMWERGLVVDVSAWRNAPDAEVDRLARVIDDAPESALARTAWLALLETRTERGWRAATDRSHIVPAFDWGKEPPYRPVDQWYHYVGFDLVDDVPTRLCGDEGFHLLFDPAYVGRDEGSWLARSPMHPTWFGIGPPTEELSFGGTLAEACAVCGEPLHHMITLDPVPSGSVIRSRSRVAFATCLSCLGYLEPTLSFAHDERGAPTPIGYDGPRRQAPFPMTALDPTTVGLVPTPGRWRFQVWENSENLHRVGGEPTWVQPPEYPACPQCTVTMHFALQLSEPLPMGDSSDELWGSGGIGYFFWCDRCAVSASRWQCT